MTDSGRMYILIHCSHAPYPNTPSLLRNPHKIATPTFFLRPTQFRCGGIKSDPWPFPLLESCSKLLDQEWQFGELTSAFWASLSCSAASCEVCSAFRCCSVWEASSTAFTAELTSAWRLPHTEAIEMKGQRSDMLKVYVGVDLSAFQVFETVWLGTAGKGGGGTLFASIGSLA